MCEPEPAPGPVETAAAAKEHNSGSRNDRREAMKSMASYAQSITSVAVTTLAFTVGFINNVHHAQWIWSLQLGWALLLGSVFFAFLVNGQYASQMASSVIKARQGPLEYFLLFDLLLLLAGLTFVTLFGFNNIGSK